MEKKMFETTNQMICPQIPNVNQLASQVIEKL